MQERTRAFEERQSLFHRRHTLKCSTTSRCRVFISSVEEETIDKFCQNESLKNFVEFWATINYIRQSVLNFNLFLERLRQVLENVEVNIQRNHFKAGRKKN